MKIPKTPCENPQKLVKLRLNLLGLQTPLSLN